MRLLVLILALLVSGVAVPPFVLPLAAQTFQPRWVTDARTGCRVWNTAPASGEKISWSGGCQGNLAQGRGHLQWFKNDKPTARYSGELRDGKLNGRGMLTMPDGAFVNGEWRDGYLNGHGVVIYPNGERYEGEFRQSRPHGIGTLKAPNGNTYAGAWTNGCFDGGSGHRATINTTPKECGF